MSRPQQRTPLAETLPKMMNLWTKDRPLCELSVRYPRRLGPDLYKVTADYVDEPVALLPLKGCESIGTCTEEPADDAAKHVVEPADNGEVPPATGPQVIVNVLLLKMPAVHTRFLYQRLEVLTASKKDSAGFYGGVVAEGDSHNALVEAAVRYLKAQANLDLSALPASLWTRFATFHSKPAQTTVFLLPRIWEAAFDLSELALHSAYYKDVEVVKKTVTTEYEEEEEVEEEVEQEVAGQEGETEEDKKMEKVKVTVKKPVKKTKHEVVETENVTTKSWGIPDYLTLEQIMTRAHSWQLKLVASLIIECVWRHATALIHAAFDEFRERAGRIQERKRKREEEAAEKEARKKAKVEEREAGLQLRLEEMQEKWKADDEGKTEEEMKEAEIERAKEKETLKAELHAEWKKDDEAEAEAEQETAMETDDTVKVATIDEDLLSACSLFDSGIHQQGFGTSPSEEISTGLLKQLFQSAAIVSKGSIDDFVKAVSTGMRFSYRVLTDQVPADE